MEPNNGRPNEGNTKPKAHVKCTTNSENISSCRSGKERGRQLQGVSLFIFIISSFITPILTSQLDSIIPSSQIWGRTAVFAHSSCHEHSHRGQRSSREPSEGNTWRTITLTWYAASDVQLFQGKYIVFRANKQQRYYSSQIHKLCCKQR
jgi:hypothetical protein